MFKKLNSATRNVASKDFFQLPISSVASNLPAFRSFASNQKLGVGSAMSVLKETKPIVDYLDAQLESVDWIPNYSNEAPLTSKNQILAEENIRAYQNTAVQALDDLSSTTEMVSNVSKRTPYQNLMQTMDVSDHVQKGINFAKAPKNNSAAPPTKADYWIDSSNSTLSEQIAGHSANLARNISSFGGSTKYTAYPRLISNTLVEAKSVVSGMKRYLDQPQFAGLLDSTPPSIASANPVITQNVAKASKAAHSLSANLNTGLSIAKNYNTGGIGGVSRSVISSAGFVLGGGVKQITNSVNDLKESFNAIWKETTPPPAALEESVVMKDKPLKLYESVHSDAGLSQPLLVKPQAIKQNLPGLPTNNKEFEMEDLSDFDAAPEVSVSVNRRSVSDPARNIASVNPASSLPGADRLSGTDRLPAFPSIPVAANSDQSLIAPGNSLGPRSRVPLVAPVVSTADSMGATGTVQPAVEGPAASAVSAAVEGPMAAAKARLAGEIPQGLGTKVKNAFSSFTNGPWGRLTLALGLFGNSEMKGDSSSDNMQRQMLFSTMAMMGIK
jgi:hypothetical protein